LEGDAALFDELLTEMEQQLPDYLSCIEQAIEDDDPASLESVAHRLAGALRTFYATPASEAAASLEKLGRERTLARAQPALDRLRLELARFLAIFPQLRQEGFAGVSTT
jgi:HPt (histidine-containing phosphotransfer) domain-containing protein